jgi:hypothetical protein
MNTVQTSGLLDRVTAYVLAARTRMAVVDDTMADPEQVLTALGFHSLQGTLRVEWRVTGGEMEPVGVAIVWQDFRATLEQLAAEGKGAFRWQRTNPEGDCLYLGLVVTSAPHVMRKLATYFRQRFPQLPELAHRRGVLREGHWLNVLQMKG